MTRQEFVEKCKRTVSKATEIVKKAGEKVASRKRTRLDMFLSYGCLILSLAILLSTVTYAWIRRNWSSTIAENELRIEANGSLAFQLDSENTSYTNAISLLQQIGDLDFTLKPVSNLTGTSYDFFRLNKDVPGQERYEHIYLDTTSTPNARMLTGKQYGYIEYHFTILGESVTAGVASSTRKFVYLVDGGASYIEAADGSATGIQAAKAIRVSITSNGNSNTEETLLFMNKEVGHDTHTGINNTGTYTSTTVDNVTTTAKTAWTADGAQYWNVDANDGTNLSVAQQITKNNVDLIDPSTGMPYELNVQNTMVYSLSDFNAGIQTDTAEGENQGKRYIDPNRCICSFASSLSQEITVRIWLEGTDVNCVDEIAGSKIKLLLSFGAVNCTYKNGKYYIEEKTVTPTPDSGS